jgi:hypothetical protein
LAVAIPVADHEAVEAHPALEDVGQQARIAVHLGPVPAGERGHHRQGPGVDRGDIALGVQADQVVFRDLRITLVVAVLGPAVAQEVLGAGGDVALLDQATLRYRALDAEDHLAGIVADDGGVFGIAFIGPAPAIVARDGQGRAERPVEAGGRGLERGRLADPADQLGIVRRAQRDVVREEGRADHIVVAMDGVDAKHQRDVRAARTLRRAFAEGPRGVDPGLLRRAVGRADRR